jgi:hypothetical protein
MKTLTCSEYLEILWNDGAMSDPISHQYWERGVDTDYLFDFMVRCAKADGIILSDRKVWDYDKALYAAYKADSDKGLS